MKNTFSAIVVSGLVMLTAFSAAAETRIYVGPAGGSTVIDDRGVMVIATAGTVMVDRIAGMIATAGIVRRRSPRVVIRERDRDADIAAGVMGFLGGFVVGSTIDGNGRVPVVRQYRDRYEPPRQLLRPWSASWYRWCDARYRSFDPRTGTFRDFDGRVKFCEARG